MNSLRQLKVNSIGARGCVFKHHSSPLQYDDLDVIEGDARLYVTPEGNHYPSITTVLSANQDKTWLEEWKNRVGEKEVERVKSYACRRGTELHDALESYVKNQDVKVATLMPDVKMMFMGIKEVLDKHVDNIRLLEAPLYSDILKIAGRVDLVAEWNGELAIIDYKTSKVVKKEDDISSYFIQAAFYGASFFERTGIPITKTVIIMAVDEKPKPIIFENSVFKWLSKVNKYSKEYQSMQIV